MINLVGFVFGLGCALCGYWLGRWHERRYWWGAMKFTMGPLTDDLNQTTKGRE